MTWHLRNIFAGEDGASMRVNTTPARTGLCARWEVVKILEVFIREKVWISGGHAHWKTCRNDRAVWIFSLNLNIMTKNQNFAQHLITPLFLVVEIPRKTWKSAR